MFVVQIWFKTKNFETRFARMFKVCVPWVELLDAQQEVYVGRVVCTDGNSCIYICL